MKSLSFREDRFYPVLEKLKQELGYYHCDVIPFPARINANNEKIGPWILFPFSFMEKDIAVLRDSHFGESILNDEIKDHNVAEIARKFCRDTASKIIISVLPFFPIFEFDFLSVYFHYNMCRPDIENTIRIYSVSVYMDKIWTLNLNVLNEQDIKEYFEFENSQIEFLFYRWKHRGVLWSDNQELA
jgi:hypothetical protein